VDISKTTAPDSTQVNAEDFLSGSRIVTITGVRSGTAEQPVNIDLAEFPGRAYRPGKSMRRILIAAWGAEASVYVGRRLELYNDPNITFGRDRTGGIRISAMSHIDKPLTVPLTVTRGRRAPFKVEPLPDAPAPKPQRDWLAELAETGGDVDLILSLGRAARAAGATPDVIAKLTDAYNDAKNAF